MRSQQITFLLAGLIVGLISAALGTFSLVFLAYGVGLLFFAAVVTSIAVTRGWRYVQGSCLRYFAGLLITTFTYLLGLFTFIAVTGSSPDWFGFRPSGNIVDFHIDVWLGLIAAGAVGASGIALFTALLTKKWSTSLLLHLILAGLVTLVVTFIANLLFHSYWSFFGFLLPLGNALFCWLVGVHIWLNHEKASVAVATAPTT
jgi:hypothetical protein